MNASVQGVLTVVGRVLLCAIFFLSAVGNKIPQFETVAGYMAKAGVPAPELMLVGAIGFLVVGSVSVVLGYRARIGASLLLVFLVLASYYFHAFWTIADPQAQQMQSIQFMKNLSMMGAMLFIIANGPGPFSLDQRRRAVRHESAVESGRPLEPSGAPARW
ncbi:MAG: DoxX family protein [Gemmataceae bacterium]|nr:DoxX family protein [Gemmataceae bacterium]